MTSLMRTCVHVSQLPSKKAGLVPPGSVSVRFGTSRGTSPPLRAAAELRIVVRIRMAPRRVSPGDSSGWVLNAPLVTLAW